MALTAGQWRQYLTNIGDDQNIELVINGNVTNYHLENGTLPSIRIVPNPPEAAPVEPLAAKPEEDTSAKRK